MISFELKEQQGVSIWDWTLIHHNAASSSTKCKTNCPCLCHLSSLHYNYTHINNSLKNTQNKALGLMIMLNKFICASVPVE